MTSNRADFTPTFNLTPDLFAQVFPFHLVFDSDLIIRQFGAVLGRICPGLAIGGDIRQHFRVALPQVEFDFAAICEQTHTVFLVDSIHIPLQLKGAMVYVPERDVLIFLCSPWVTEVASLRPLGLSLHDFAVQDPIVDLLLLLQTQQTSLADLKKLTDKLSKQREQLRKKNQELVDQYAEQRRLQEEVNTTQARTLAELSTPLIPISDQIVVMPLIGAIDSQRAQRVLETLLQGIGASHARVAIVDITGVPVVDSYVAEVLIRAAQAVRLLGADVIITGVRPEVAQSLVGLGLEMRGIITHSTIQRGIQYALQRRGGR